MSIEDNQIEIRLIKSFQWSFFQKNFLRMFADNPELHETSRKERKNIFCILRKKAENYFCYFKGKKAGLLSF